MNNEFDTLKGAFFLVAIVVATQMAVILVAVGSCAFLIVEDPKIFPGICTTLRESISELFTMAFTASIAFAGGRMSAPQPPQLKVPPEPKPKPELKPEPNTKADEGSK